jgi:hypothetical protein
MKQFLHLFPFSMIFFVFPAMWACIATLCSLKFIH